MKARVERAEAQMSLCVCRVTDRREGVDGVTQQHHAALATRDALVQRAAVLPPITTHIHTNGQSVLSTVGLGMVTLS